MSNLYFRKGDAAGGDMPLTVTTLLSAVSLALPACVGTRKLLFTCAGTKLKWDTTVPASFPEYNSSTRVCTAYPPHVPPSPTEPYSSRPAKELNHVSFSMYGNQSHQEDSFARNCTVYSRGLSVASIYVQRVHCGQFTAML